MKGGAFIPPSLIVGSFMEKMAERKTLKNTKGEIRWTPFVSDLKIDWQAHRKRTKLFDRQLDKAHESSIKLNLAFRQIRQHQI